MGLGGERRIVSITKLQPRAEELSARWVGSVGIKDREETSYVSKTIPEKGLYSLARMISSNALAWNLCPSVPDPE